MKVAGVQMDVKLADVDANIERIIDKTHIACEAGASLVVFPECALTGYCFESLEEAKPYAETVPGPTTERLIVVCAELNCHVIFGMLEADGDRIFNAAVLVGPNGVVGNYRKVHLPYLGIDMFTSYGDQPFAVHEAGEIRVGMNICYDAAFPEAARSLALLGADLIVLPTNWPPGAECIAEKVISARAVEDAVYFMAINRVGTERGFEFIGKSSICDPGGNVLAEASGTEEAILYAEIDPERSRRKLVVRVPNKHEIDRFADRRPEMYGELTTAHSLKTPRQSHAR